VGAAIDTASPLLWADALAAQLSLSDATHSAVESLCAQAVCALLAVPDLQPAAALEAMARALETGAPAASQPVAWLVLASLQVLSGNPAAALLTLRQATTHLPTSRLVWREYVALLLCPCVLCDGVTPW
jgi:hypothetical protein